jgi:murein DD-endopeptidase MepM/ murein hydrolase activator NlpD
MDFDSYIRGLLNEVEGLFGTKPQSAPTRVSQNPINYPEGYTAPIHGSWASSGGFTYTPSGSHPHGHMGVDMRCQAGTPVYPLTSGVVTNVGTDPMGGNVVNVQHANGIRTYYAHLSVARVQKGDRVTPNTVLGLVGNTGNASHTVPHCHFQVWKDNQIQDPANYFHIPPYTNLSAEERQQPKWVSEQAKQEALAFNMQEHVAQGRVAGNRVAFSTNADKLLVLSHQYYKLTKKLST